MSKNPYNNLQLEYAFRLVFGSKYYGTASRMGDSRFFRKALRDWVKKVRPRVIELTNYDQRLRERLLSHLSELDDELKKFPQEDNATNIMAIFVSIISRILGYDWGGIINREVIFFQNEGHERLDLKYKGEITAKEEIHFHVEELEKKTKEVVEKLRQEGLKDWQIAQILKISPSQVSRIRNR